MSAPGTHIFGTPALARRAAPHRATRAQHGLSCGATLCARCEHADVITEELGQQFIDWLISDEGQKAIADYKIDGEQLFWPQRE